MGCMLQEDWLYALLKNKTQSRCDEAVQVAFQESQGIAAKAVPSYLMDKQGFSPNVPASGPISNALVGASLC